MTETYMPFNGTDVYQSQWSQFMRTVMADGVVGAGDLLTIGDSTGMQVKTAIGAAWNHGFFYNNDAQITSVIGANASGNPRIDSVVLSLDEVGNSIHTLVVAGTPASSPVAPTLTQVDGTTWQIALAHVAVASGAATITAGNVTDVRSFAKGSNAPTILAAVGDTGATTLSATPAAFGAAPVAVTVPPSGNIKVTASIDANGFGTANAYLVGAGANTGNTSAGTLGTLASGIGAFVMSCGKDAAAENCSFTVVWYITGLTPGVTDLHLEGVYNDTANFSCGGTLLVEAY